MAKTSILAIAMLAVLPAAAHACADIAGATKLESERYVLAYRTNPANVPVGQHFTMDLAVCPKSSQPAPETVRIDAQMPEHRHGMNYRTTVKPGADGLYLAEGFMFHMPGRWEFIFEVRGSGK